MMQTANINRFMISTSAAIDTLKDRPPAAASASALASSYSKMCKEVNI
jgi:hypothetical protein